jgi:hypothetical protein
MRTMVITAFTVSLLAGVAIGAHAQTGAGSSGAAATGTAGMSSNRGDAGPNSASGGAASDAAKARVGAVRGVTGEAPKPAADATGPGAAGAVQGAGAVK